MKNYKNHILVVDDDDGIRDLVKQYLSQNDYFCLSLVYLFLCSCIAYYYIYFETYNARFNPLLAMG